MKTRDIKIIEDRDFDKLVEETYGITYCFQQQDNCKPRGTHYFTVPSEYDCDENMNTSIPEIINGELMGVKLKTWLERKPNSPLNVTLEELKKSNYFWEETEEEADEYRNRKSNIDMFYQRNFYPDFDVLINDLHKKGLIEAGEYGIEIDW